MVRVVRPVRYPPAVVRHHDEGVRQVAWQRGQKLKGDAVGKGVNYAKVQSRWTILNWERVKVDVCCVKLLSCVLSATNRYSYGLGPQPNSRAQPLGILHHM